MPRVSEAGQAADDARLGGSGALRGLFSPSCLGDGGGGECITSNNLSYTYLGCGVCGKVWRGVAGLARVWWGTDSEVVGLVGCLGFSKQLGMTSRCIVAVACEPVGVLQHTACCVRKYC